MLSSPTHAVAHESALAESFVTGLSTYMESNL